MRGWREIWLWTPETLTAAGHFDLYSRQASGLIFGGQLIAGIMERTSNSTVLEEQNGHPGRPGSRVRRDTAATRRAAAVALPITDADDKLQASVEPSSCGFAWARSTPSPG
ncbi:MAG: hypothetical protein R3F60_33635 [bacterium]